MWLFKLWPRGNRRSLIFIGLILVFTLWVVSADRIKIGGFEREGQPLGLDLKGGTHLVYEAVDPENVTAQQMAGVAKIIERRINAFGVSEPIVQQLGEDRLLVQLPGVTDIEQAKRLIGSTAVLEFREQRVAEDGSPILGETGEIQWIPATALGDGAGQPLTGEFLNPNSQVVVDPATGLPEVAFQLTGQGASIFEKVTTRLIGRQLGIFLDGEVISAPTVQAVISENGVITGLTLDDAEVLAIQLNAGALPVPIKIIQEQDLDATLGADSLSRSIVAGVVGLGLVLTFLVLYYRLPGVLAAVALLIYALMVLATFKLIPVTLTLAGIAGFIISIGMAVDANILIFERMKEELRDGRTLKAAIEAGFNRAWTAIRDGNVSTIITCAILFWFGSRLGAPLVMGFAITLGIGVALSMFSAIFVTRSFLRFLAGPALEGKKSWFLPEKIQEEGNPSDGGAAGESRMGGFLPDLVSKRRYYVLFSGILLAVGIISLLIPPALKPGIEFSSGTVIDVLFPNPVDIERRVVGVAVEQSALRPVLADLGHDEAIIQRTGENTFLIRLNTLEEGTFDSQGREIPPESERIKDALERRFGEVGKFDISLVSPIIAAETVRNAFFAVLAASVAILFYITWAFRKLPRPFRYGVVAVITLIHDVLIVVGIFSILGKVFGIEVNAMFITGLLAVIGYSVNDTIVVFDRIRENMLQKRDRSFAATVNISLLETLGRSVNTSLTTLIPLLALLLFGGVTLRPFILVLFIGIIAGTYSSIFIASQMLVMWDKGEFGVIWRRVQLLAGLKSQG